MVADEASFFSNCPSCAKGKIQGRRWTNLLGLFPATDPFVDVYLDLLGPRPETDNVNEYLLVIVYRFTKLTLVVPIPNQDAETVVSAFLHTWVAA